MTSADALRATVLANPTDDTARLVLADLLRESDDPDAQAQGRFLWAGVTAAQLRDRGVIDDPQLEAARREIASVAEAGCPAKWVATLGLGPAPFTFGDWRWKGDADCIVVSVGNSSGYFTRGMLSRLALTLGEWYALAPAALALWPIEIVSATDVPGLLLLLAAPMPHAAHGGCRRFCSNSTHRSWRSAAPTGKPGRTSATERRWWRGPRRRPPGSWPSFRLRRAMRGRRLGKARSDSHQPRHWNQKVLPGGVSAGRGTPGYRAPAASVSQR